MKVFKFLNLESSQRYLYLVAANNKDEAILTFLNEDLDVDDGNVVEMKDLECKTDKPMIITGAWWYND